MQERALRLLAPAPIPIRAAILGPVDIPGQAGDCSPRSAPSRRGTFRTIFSGPSVSHPRGQSPGAAPTPRSLPLPFTFQLPRSWKVGAGTSRSRTVFRGASLGSTLVGTLPCRPSGRGQPAKLVGRWWWWWWGLSAGPSPHSRAFSGRVPEHRPKP